IPVADDLSGGINLVSQEIPFVDAAPDGRFVVAWSTELDGIYFLEARRFDASGVALGAKIQIFGLWHPDVLVNSDGSFLIAGEDLQGGVYARLYDRDGNSLTQLFPMFGGDRRENAMPVLAARGTTGGFVAAWRSGNP